MSRAFNEIRDRTVHFDVISLAGLVTVKVYCKTSIKMKITLLLAALLYLGMAQEQPQYECPEYNVDYEGNNWWKVPYDITTWEECGKP